MNAMPERTSLIKSLNNPRDSACHMSRGSLFQRVAPLQLLSYLYNSLCAAKEH